MAKLSDITRRENCLMTVDGRVLKTIQDLHDYLNNCSEESYNHHVTEQKNDFADWVMNVLARPRFSKVLSNAKTLTEARNDVAELLQKIDYRSKFIPYEKAFHTVDSYALKSVHELYYYLNNCDDGSFSYHCNSQKNDFANWVNDVLGFPSLSKRIRIQVSRNGVIDVLKDFLYSRLKNVTNPEYEQYLNDHNIDNGVQKEASIPESTPVIPVAESVPVTESAQVANNTAAVSAPVVESSPAVDSVSVSPTGSAPVVESSPVVDSVSASPTDSSNGEETITLKPLDLESKEEDEDEKKEDVSLDTNSFRQFTDEELEKFTSFIRQEKSEDVDVKTEYLNSVLLELKNMLKELRRAEKDPFIAELLLRTVSAKIAYYAQSRNPDDYNHIIRLMKDVQREIEECSSHKTYNLAEEIMKDLKLQGITLKK